MTEMKNTEFVIFERSGLDDFRQFILENVWEELFQIDSFYSNGILTIGALYGGQPCGALVARIYDGSDENVLYIDSVAVASSLQRRGIGSGLADAAVKEAYKLFGGPIGEDEERLNLSVLADFYSSEYDKSTEAFLKAIGFTEFTIAEKSWIVSDQKLKFAGRLGEAYNAGFKPAEGIKCFADETAEIKGEIEEYLDYIGYDAEPAFSFFAGEAEDPRGLLMIAYTGEHDYSVASYCGDKCTGKDYLDMLTAAINAIIKKDKDFDLIIDGQYNVFPDGSAEDELMTVAELFEHVKTAMYVTVE